MIMIIKINNRAFWKTRYWKQNPKMKFSTYKDNNSVWQMYFLFSTPYFQFLFLDLFL